ncbi:MAG: hypothetical protein AAGH15_01200 [Myxococcota bacterium]
MRRVAPLLLVLGCVQLTDSDLGGAARRQAARDFDDRIVLRDAERREGSFVGTGAPFVGAVRWSSAFVAGSELRLAVDLPEGSTLLWELEDAGRRYALRPEDGTFVVDVTAEGVAFPASPRLACLAAEDAAGVVGAPLCLPLFATETAPPNGILSPRVFRMHGVTERTEAVAFHGGRLHSGSSSGEIAILQETLPPTQIVAHEGAVWDIDADADGFVSAGGNRVRVWTPSGELVEEYAHPDVRSVIRRGEVLCSAGRNGVLRCGERELRLDERINVMTADADADMLLLGLGRLSFPGSVALVDRASMRVVARAATGDSVTALAVAGERVAAAFGRGEVVLYDRALEERARFDALGGGVDGLAFQGPALVALTLDGAYAIWTAAGPEGGAPDVLLDFGVEGYDLAIVDGQGYLGMSRGAVWTFPVGGTP